MAFGVAPTGFGQAPLAFVETVNPVGERAKLFGITGKAAGGTPALPGTAAREGVPLPRRSVQRMPGRVARARVRPSMERITIAMPGLSAARV